MKGAAATSRRCNLRSCSACPTSRRTRHARYALSACVHQLSEQCQAVPDWHVPVTTACAWPPGVHVLAGLLYMCHDLSLLVANVPSEPQRGLCTSR